MEDKEVVYFRGKRYRVVEESGCDNCDLRPDMGEVCYNHVWTDYHHVRVVCGVRDVIFKEANG